MKKSVVLLASLMLVSCASFAKEYMPATDIYGNTVYIVKDTEPEMNEMLKTGTWESLEIHFNSESKKTLSGYTYIDSKLYWWTASDEEAFLIPDTKFAQVYDRYRIPIEELETILNNSTLERALSALNHRNIISMAK